MRITRLNHAVLFVEDLPRSVAFYREVLGFELVADEGAMVFLRAPGSANHHDLGLARAVAARGPRGAVGLYHLAWEVGRIEELAEAVRILEGAGALVGTSDHGATKSVYGVDPDGNELEIMWMVPAEAWGQYADRGVVMPLDLEAELTRWGRSR